MPEVEDPVCGMTFPEEDAEALGAETFDHEGETYYLCSPTCREAFEEAPEEHLG